MADSQLPQGDLAGAVYTAGENAACAAFLCEEAVELVRRADPHHALIAEYGYLRRRLVDLAERTSRIADTIVEHA